MPNIVKVYFIHQREEDAARRAVADGILRDAEITDTYVLGTLDGGAVDGLEKQGLVVSAVEPAFPLPGQDSDTSGNRFDALGTLGAAEAATDGSVVDPGEEPFTATPRSGVGQRYLLRIEGPLTEARKKKLAEAGSEDLERDLSGWYVVRAGLGPGPLEALPFVAQVRLYGIEETLAPPGGDTAARGALAGLASRRAAAQVRPRAQEGGRYEALLHAGADAQLVADAVRDRGGAVLSAAGRIVRFSLGTGIGVGAVAALPDVADVHEVRPVRPLHDLARRIIGMTVEVGAPSDLPYDGEGEIVGVADTGIDVEHDDFQGRIHAVVALGRPGNPSDPDGHGTHVAGTVLGDGTASDGRLAGVAPRAKLYFQSLLDVNKGLGGLPSKLGDLFQQAYDQGVRVHNNSWGAFLHSRYAGMSLEVDEFVASHRDFLPVIAAGNDGSCLPGAHSEAGFVDFPSLAAPATAKNALTVGASRSNRTQGGFAALTYGQTWADNFNEPPIADETVSGDPQSIAAFSGRGPCDDMRIKPDLVAPGTDIASTRSRLAPLRNFWGAYPRNPKYAFNGGTSMACPMVAGCVTLVRQFYRRDRGHQPSAALLKATIVNGTERMTGASAAASPEGMPNYHQGFGLVSLRRTLPNPGAPGLRLAFIDEWQSPGRQFVRTGQRFKFRLRLDAQADLRLCLAWTDPPARGLQNALFMILDDNQGTKRFANDGAATLLALFEAGPHGGTGLVRRDPNNNVQVIRASAVPAGSYTLAVVADNLLRGPQDFALVVTGAVAALDAEH